MTDVLCFGTLAQRSPTSAATICRFLEALPVTALRVFDVNLRQSYFNRDVIQRSLRRCDIVKLNHNELPHVAQLLNQKFVDEISSARELLDRYQLKVVCITRGENGSLLVDSTTTSTHPGFRIKVADTIGAGDAFTACLAHYYVNGCGLDEINSAANRFAGWVASQHGGTPSLNGRSIEELLSGNQL